MNTTINIGTPTDINAFIDALRGIKWNIDTTRKFLTLRTVSHPFVGAIDWDTANTLDDAKATWASIVWDKIGIVDRKLTVIKDFDTLLTHVALHRGLKSFVTALIDRDIIRVDLDDIDDAKAFADDLRNAGIIDITII